MGAARSGVVGGDLARALVVQQLVRAGGVAAGSASLEDEHALMYSPSRSFLRERIRSARAVASSSSDIESAAAQQAIIGSAACECAMLCCGRATERTEARSARRSLRCAEYRRLQKLSTQPSTPALRRVPRSVASGCCGACRLGARVDRLGLWAVHKRLAEGRLTRERGANERCVPIYPAAMISVPPRDEPTAIEYTFGTCSGQG